jgi:hypothetical protein
MAERQEPARTQTTSGPADFPELDAGILNLRQPRGRATPARDGAPRPASVGEPHPRASSDTEERPEAAAAARGPSAASSAPGSEARRKSGSAAAGGSERNGAPPQHAKEVQEFFRQICITEKNLELYPSFSKVVKASVEKLGLVANATLEQTGPLRLRVTQQTFLYEETPIYQEESKGRNLAFRVYQDGVREIVFLPDVSNEELGALATCLQESRNADEEDDDFTTLFWEKDCAHIQLQLADDYLSREDLIAVPSLESTVDLLKLQKFKVPKEEKDNLLQALENRQDDAEGDDSFELSEAETASIREMVHHESSYFPVFDFVDILLELMARNPHPDDFENSLKMLRTLIGTVISELDFERAASLFSRLGAEAHPAFSAAQVQKIRDMLATFNDKQTIFILESYLAENERLSPQNPVFLLMRAFPTSAIEAFCPFLRFQNHAHAVSNVLIQLGAGQVSTLAKYLDDPDPLIVRAMIQVLVGADRANSIEHLARALHHSDPTVRAHAAQSILDNADETAGHLFLPLLTENSKQLLSLALQFFARFPYPDAYENLEKLVKSKNFGLLDQKKQRMCFRAILRSSYSRAIEFLDRRVLRWTFAFRQLGLARKSAALFALAFVDTDKSRILLEKFSRNEKSPLSSVARRSLKELDKLATAEATGARSSVEVIHG